MTTSKPQNATASQNNPDAIECSVVKDLLPLVIDGLASENTTRLVMEHLQTCPNCQKRYEQMQPNASEENVSQSVDAPKIDAMKKYKKRQNKRLWLMLAAGLAAGALAYCGSIYLPQKNPAGWVYSSIQQQEGKISLQMQFYKSGEGLRKPSIIKEEDNTIYIKELSSKASALTSSVQQLSLTDQQAQKAIYINEELRICNGREVPAAINGLLNLIQQPGALNTDFVNILTSTPMVRQFGSCKAERILSAEPGYHWKVHWLQAPAVGDQNPNKSVGKRALEQLEKDTRFLFTIFPSLGSLDYVLNEREIPQTISYTREELGFQPADQAETSDMPSADLDAVTLAGLMQEAGLDQTGYCMPLYPNVQASIQVANLTGKPIQSLDWHIRDNKGNPISTGGQYGQPGAARYLPGEVFQLDFQLPAESFYTANTAELIFNFGSSSASCSNITVLDGGCYELKEQEGQIVLLPSINPVGWSGIVGLAH